MNATPTTLADRLTQARLQNALGQEAVAKAVGMSQPSYSALETGKSKATTKIGSLAHVLQVDAYWLETGKGAMASQLRVEETRARYDLQRMEAVTPEELRVLKILRAMEKSKRDALISYLSK